MANSATLSSLAALVANGVPKDECPIRLDAELSALWDALVAEYKEFKAKGWVFEIPAEMPDVEVRAPQKKMVGKQADREEIKTFIKFLGKSPKRPFEFVHIPEIYGDILNKFVKAGDVDSARKYAERYLE